MQINIDMMKEHGDMRSLKPALHHKINRLKFGIKHFDEMGVCAETKDVFIKDGFEIYLNKGICDNFTSFDDYANLSKKFDLCNYNYEISDKWQVLNKITHGYSGYFISGIDEYAEFKGRLIENLYKNPLRLSAMKFYLAHYEDLVARINDQIK